MDYRSEFDGATGKVKKPTKSTKKAKDTSNTEEKKGEVEEARYVGCFASEVSFVDRVYNGGSTGANYNLALHHAKTSKKKYFAVARGGGDGHAFAFSAIDGSKGMLQGEGCERPCLDNESKVCGCIDTACSGPIPRGEEHNRRWAVYELLPPARK